MLDGRGYRGNLTVSFTGGSPPGGAPRGSRGLHKTAVVFTGAGDDVIRTGEGNSWVDSGGGSDLVTTLDRTDLADPIDPDNPATANVAGGPGRDTITVGNGNDTVTGDGTLTAASAAADVVVTLADLDKDGNAVTTTLGGPTGRSTRRPGLPSDAELHADNPLGSGADQIAAGLGQVVCPATVATTPSAPPTTTSSRTPTASRPAPPVVPRRRRRSTAPARPCSSAAPAAT